MKRSTDTRSWAKLSRRRQYGKLEKQNKEVESESEYAKSGKCFKKKKVGERKLWKSGFKKSFTHNHSAPEVSPRSLLKRGKAAKKETRKGLTRKREFRSGGAMQRERKFGEFRMRVEAREVSSEKRETRISGRIESKNWRRRRCPLGNSCPGSFHFFWQFLRKADGHQQLWDVNKKRVKKRSWRRWEAECFFRNSSQGFWKYSVCCTAGQNDFSTCCCRRFATQRHLKRIGRRVLLVSGW